ncbi:MULTISPECIES: hypothetical protein [Bacillus cereus group]|uniref:hypothetical protein n=1 Tax=Bacillus cereus group TaxID=86661 RepID=UPI0001A0AE6C|nr:MULTISPECIES: hypothetical protein [Bacillus cereus group]EEL49287.1 hypothetical protein bcere0022_33970 [Bacillus cereus Rock3-44]
MFQNWVQWMLLEQRVPFVYCGSVCGLHTYEMTSKQDVFMFLDPVGSYRYHV